MLITNLANNIGIQVPIKPNRRYNNVTVCVCFSLFALQSQYKRHKILNPPRLNVNLHPSHQPELFGVHCGCRRQRERNVEALFWKIQHPKQERTATHIIPGQIKSSAAPVPVSAVSRIRSDRFPYEPSDAVPL